MTFEDKKRKGKIISELHDIIRSNYGRRISNPEELLTEDCFID